MNARRTRPAFRRRNLASITVLLMCSLVAVCGFSYSKAQSDEKEERELAEKIPKHLPIKVKVKKPEKLKDSKNEDWLDDMEIEVTNTGTKPIYFLSIHLAMPDVLAEDGHKYVFLYKYGRIDLAAFEEPVRPDDVPLLPGETVTLTPPANHIEGWRSLREKGKVINPKKLELKFQEINHGDGTGFLGTGGTPMPVSKQRSANWPHAGDDADVGRHTALPDSRPNLFLASAYVTTLTSPPVSFLPAIFTRGDFTAEPGPRATFAARLRGQNAYG